MSKGYSSGGYGSGVGYSAGKSSHTNKQKALFHGLKAARRWAENEDHDGAAEIAQSVSSLWLVDCDVATPDWPFPLLEGRENRLRRDLMRAENAAKRERYREAAKTALSAARAYRSRKPAPWKDIQEWWPL